MFIEEGSVVPDGVELDYVLPAPDLRPFVSLVYRFRFAGARLEDVERAQLAQLRVHVSPGAGEYRFCDGTRASPPRFHLLGPTTGPTRASVEGPVLVFGIGLTAAGWGVLLGTDASALANRAVDATPLFGGALAAAALTLRAEDGAAAMAAVAEPHLRRMVAGDHAAILAFVAAVDAWLADAPSPDLGVLVATTGLSRRQVERRCNALYGCPPKLLARKYRALRAAVALAADGTPGEGFYDQSHMIREVKQFTGLTPGRMRDTPGMLAALTITQRRALGGQVARIVSET